MKSIYLIIFVLCYIPGFCQDIKQDSTQSFRVTRVVNGEKVTEVVEIDTATARLLDDLINGNTPKPVENKNDSIYNDDGRLTKVILSDDFYGAAIKKFIYNEEGQLIQVIGLDKVGNIAPYFEYLAIREIDYDDKGRVIEKRAFDENHEYVRRCAYPPVLQISYDETGNKQEMVYLNQTREFHEGYTRTEYIYNEENTLIETINYNGKGEIIKRETVLNTK